MVRLSISGLMGLVAVVALGLAAMRAGTALAAAVATGLMVASLAVASLGAVVRPAPASGWRGFAIFGWTYLILTFLRPDLGWDEHSPIVTGALIHSATERLHPRPDHPELLEVMPRPSIRFDPDGKLIIPPRRGAPVSKEEVAEARAYHDTRESYNQAIRDQDGRTENSRRIGHASLTVAFGLVGALAGRAMTAGRPWPAAPPMVARAGEPTLDSRQNGR